MSEFLPMESRKYRVLKEMKITSVGYGGFFPSTDVAVGDIIKGNTRVGRLGDCQVTHIEGNDKWGQLSPKNRKDGRPTKPSGPYGHVLYNPSFLEPLSDG